MRLHRLRSTSSSGAAVRQLRASAIMITGTTPSSAGGDGPPPASSSSSAAAVACPSLLDALATARAPDTTGGGSHAAPAAPQAARATRSKRGACTAAPAAGSPATARLLCRHTQGEESGAPKAAGDGAAGKGAAAARDPTLGGSDAPLARSSPAATLHARDGQSPHAARLANGQRPRHDATRRRGAGGSTCDSLGTVLVVVSSAMLTRYGNGRLRAAANRAGAGRGELLSRGA